MTKISALSSASPGTTALLVAVVNSTTVKVTAQDVVNIGKATSTGILTSGSIWYGNASGEVTELAPGASGSILSMQAALPAYSSRIFVNASAVGIGTTAPGNTLCVQGSTQYQGMQVRSGVNAIIDLNGLSAGNEDGGITLFSSGVAQVQLLANGNSYVTGQMNLKGPVVSSYTGTTGEVANWTLNRYATFTGGTPGEINGGLRVINSVSSGVTSNEWAIVGLIRSSAVGGEHVAVYGQAYGNSSAAVWGMVAESSMSGTGTAVGMEVDCGRSSGAGHAVGIDVVNTGTMDAAIRVPQGTVGLANASNEALNITFDSSGATVNGKLTVTGDQSGAADHVFDEYDDLELLGAWRVGGVLPFEIGDVLDRDRVLRDAIVQLASRVRDLEARILPEYRLSHPETGS